MHQEFGMHLFRKKILDDIFEVNLYLDVHVEISQACSKYLCLKYESFHFGKPKFTIKKLLLTKIYSSDII